LPANPAKLQRSAQRAKEIFLRDNPERPLWGAEPRDRYWPAAPVRDSVLNDRFWFWRIKQPKRVDAARCCYLRQSQSRTIDMSDRAIGCHADRGFRSTNAQMQARHFG